MKLLRICLATFVLALLSTPAAHAAVTLVLHIDGIQGESTIPGFENDILVGSVSFSVEQAVALKEASKAGITPTKAAFAPIIISKGADKASPPLFLNSIFGKTPLKSARLTFLSSQAGPNPTYVEFFSIYLGNVYISKFGFLASIGDENTQEEVTLNYQMILLNYTPKLGTPIRAGFDLIKNKEIMSLPGIPE